MKYYVTTPIYYVNAKPHIGHTYTTVIADVMARYKRLRGDKVFFLTGTDEHGDKISKKAQEENMEVEKFTDKIAASFKEEWKDMNISFDEFIRTTSDKHKKGVERIFQKLKESNDIYEKDYKGLYCTGCESFKTQKELEDGKCPDHKIEPETIKEKNYFFKLKKYAPAIEKMIKNDEFIIMPETKKKEILSLLNQDLEDFSITRENVKWGIDVPFAKNQKIYVWVEALMNYITALDFGEKGEESEKYKTFWPADVHLVGKDIIKFHAIYWPAILLSIGIKLPKMIYAHGFFTVNGQKISKTLGNVIKPGDLMDKWGVDAARFLILTQFPLGQDGDFSMEKMQAKYESRLANDLGNLLQRTLSMMNKYGIKPVDFNGSPYSKESSDELHFDCKVYFGFDKEELIEKFDNFKLSEALNMIEEIMINGNRFLEENKPWELHANDKEKCEKVLKNVYTRLVTLAYLIEPIMPETTNKMVKQLKSMKPEILFKK